MTMSRELAEIDWKQVEELCRIQCTQDEIAAVIGWCVDTIDKHCKIDNKVSFSDFLRQKRNGGKSSLRRTQWNMAKKIPVMAIFLGKQYLGQADQQKIDTTHEIKMPLGTDEDGL